MNSSDSRKFDGLGEILLAPSRPGYNRITGEREGDRASIHDPRRRRLHAALDNVLDSLERQMRGRA
jgi:hypothetical protein